MNTNGNWFSFDFRNKNYFVSCCDDRVECRSVHTFGKTVYISKKTVQTEKIQNFAERLSVRKQKQNHPSGLHYSLKERVENGTRKCGVAVYEGLHELHAPGAMSHTFTNTVLVWWLRLVLCILIALASIVIMSDSTAAATVNLFDGESAPKMVSFVLIFAYTLYLLGNDKSWPMLLLMSVTPMCFVAAYTSCLLDEKAKTACILITEIYVLALVVTWMLKGAKKIRIKTNYMKVFLSYILLCAAVSEMVLVSSTYSASAEKPLDAAVIEENYLDALHSVTNEKWESLDKEGKLEVMTAICNYECEINLGFNSPAVRIAELDAYIYGNYSQSERLITVNSLYINELSAQELIKTLLHEIRHCYQHELIKMYRKLEYALSPQLKRLEPFRLAKKFSDNSKDYTKVSESVEGYYYQSVEMDSREWASERINFYIPYIEYEQTEQGDDFIG